MGLRAGKVHIMTLRTAVALLAPVLGVWAVAHAEPPGPDKVRAVQAADDCTVATASAPYQGMGYTHMVELKNNCAKPVTCEVWTNVDPQPRYTLQVKPGESASVATRKGSPAREFKAQKSCKY
jgi:hypothetical protein